MTLSRRGAAQLVLGSLGLAVAGCAGIDRQASYHVIDLMPAFWDFWAQAQSLPEEARPALFRKVVVSCAPQAYAAGVIGLAPDKPYETELARRYHRVQSLIGDRMDAMRRLSERIALDLRGYEATFRRTFPDLAYRGDIYFMHSLGGFDGGTRQIGGHTALLFGLDMITYVYGAQADPQPFFHHELFHVYHAQFSGDVEGGRGRLVEALWSEGLATYVAQALNPQAKGVSIFGLPHTPPGRGRANLPSLARKLREQLESSADDDYRRWFVGTDDRDEVPARAGYVIGFLVAQKLAERHRLIDLAHAPLSRLQPQIGQALAGLAS
jgi:Predicted Zn-dependent protease (DUF2268)